MQEGRKEGIKNKNKNKNKEPMDAGNKVGTWYYAA